jgi:cation transport regulator ChaB
MVARHVPQRRRILHELSIGKIAAVDRPCQEHARMTLMKRADDDVEKKYKSVDELPASVKDALPEAAQRQFMAVANSVLSGGGNDEAAFKQAWGALKNAGWHKDENDNWVKKSSEDETDDEPLTVAEKQQLDALQKAVDDLVEKEWSDEARAAALAARQGHAHGGGAPDTHSILTREVTALRDRIPSLAEMPDDKFNAIVSDLVTAKSIDKLKFADKHGISVGLANKLNEERKVIRQTLFGSSGPSLDQAGRIARHLRENRIRKDDEGDEPMTAAEKQQLDELQKTVADLTKALAGATGDDVKKTATDLTKAQADVVADLTKKLEAAQAATAEAVVKAGMSDAEKEHMASLSGDAAKNFAACSPEDRKKQMSKAVDSNPVIFKSVSGEEFRKNDDPRLVKMAKQADESERIAKEERTKRENAEFAKRADDDLKPYSDDVAKRDDKIEVLRAIDKMDEGPKAAVLKMLSVGAKAINAAFQSIGTQAGQISKSADAFEKRVTEVQSRDKIGRSAAMTKAREEFPDEFKAFQDADASARAGN